MKIFKNKISYIVASALAGASLAGCTLDMLPLNEVVLENYWTDKNDVESVVTSCYVGLTEGGYVSDMIVWGETRSDNVRASDDVPGPLRDLMKGSLRTTNSYCDWSAMYKVINRCNTVLYYAPLVAQKDPNYTESDLRVNVAECKALRAMSYLTLIKTFKDVPFTLDPSIDDNVDYNLPQTKFEVILDSLILDIESCKDDAPRRYTQKEFNSGKITRSAMYSLLAEMYLWRASDHNLSVGQQNEYYRKCIACCDWVINYKIQQYKDNNIEGLDLKKCVDSEVYSKYGYPLLSFLPTQTNERGYNGFEAMFSQGNSYESIFEITYHYGSTNTINEDLGFMYGGSTDKNEEKKYVAADAKIMPSDPKQKKFDNNQLFSTNTDFRTIFCFNYTEGGATYPILKYACDDIPLSYKGEGSIDYVKNVLEKNSVSYRSHERMYQNWIVYRLSEIMLFRAEAEIELAGNLDKIAEEEAKAEAEKEKSEEGTSSARRREAAVNGASLATAKELYDDAYKLICAVMLRSNPEGKNNTSVLPVRNDLKSYDDFEVLIMNERQRELLFEGKRYYDLVRQARREGNTSKFVAKLTSKYGEGGSAIAIKMKQMDFMYMPVLKKQMQVNLNLEQNSCYLDEESITNN